MTTQTITFGIEEQNGLFNLERVNFSIEENNPVSEYLKTRKIQSKKGFKRPMPISVSIEDVYINVKG